MERGSRNWCELTDVGDYQRAASSIYRDTDRTAEETVADLLRLGRRRFDTESAQLAVIDERRCSVPLAVGSTLVEVGEDHPVIEPACRRLESGDGLTVAIDDAEADGLSYCVATRIVAERGNYGAICFADGSSREEPFPPADRAFFQQIARYVETSLQRSRRWETLEELHAITRRLMDADSPEAVADRAVSAFDETLSLPVAGIWLHDEDVDALVPTACSSRGREIIGDPPTYDGSGSISWEAFRTGETRQFDDVRRSETVHNEGTVIRSELVVPLGDHGVVNVGDIEPEAFDPTTVAHAELLARNIESALESVSRERSLQAARDRFRTFFEAANDALLVVDAAENVVVECNERATSLLGYDREEIIGSQPSTFHPNETAVVETFNAEIDEQGDSHTENITYTTKNGRLVPASVSTSVVEVRGDPALLIHIRNIAERKRQERLNAVLNRVLRHNLRNDMNVIVGYAEVLAEAADDEFERPAARIVEHANSLLSLSDKARDIQTKVIDELAGERYTPERLLERVRTAIERRHGVIVEFATPEDTPAVGGELYSALFELVENAVEHAESEAPTVEIDASVDAGTVLFTVTDDGPGIPPADRAVLHTDEETPLSHGGGLGLWLVRWIVADLGGDVEIVETGSEGSRIRVAVPPA